MSDRITVDEPIKGVTRFNIALRNGILTSHSYLLTEGPATVLVDAGPASEAAALVAQIARHVQPRKIDFLVLTDSNPFGASGAHALRRAGFAGQIVADWRTALEMTIAELPGPYRFVYKINDELSLDGRLVLQTVGLAHAPGRLCVADATGRCLFSGVVGSSMGRNAPLSGAPAAHRRDFRHAFGDYNAEIAPMLDAFGDRVTARTLVLPRFGAAIEVGRLVGELPGAGTAADFATTADQDAAAERDIQSLIGEIDRLRSDNIELRSAMVMSSDAALRDQHSGLYGREYAEQFLQSLLDLDAVYHIGFVQIDRLREINRVAGTEAGDALIADAAAVLTELADGGYMFRWSGPVFMVVVEQERDQALAEFERIREHFARERRFSRPLTVSVALVGTDEIKTDPTQSPIKVAQRLASTRLKILERRGGNGVLAETPEHLEVKYSALILDGNPIEAAFLAEYFNRYDFSAIGAAKGRDALQLMNDVTPEIVVADAYLPQFDAFQIRSRMLESRDLRYVPFVLLVQAKSDQLVERAHGLGVFHIFERPIAMQELLGVMRHLVERSSDDGRN